MMVSIIVPIYNGEKYLQQCIESILAQSMKDFELLLINDGSTDTSLDICMEYRLKDERIKVIDNENQGVSKARNIGIDMAKGDFIAFVDCDDILSPNYLLYLCQGMTLDDVDMTICGYLSFHENDEWKIEEITGDYRFSSYSSQQAIKNVFYDEKYKELQGYVWNRLFKREIVYNYNIRFCEKMKYSEDKLFIIQYLSKASKILEIDNILYYYRICGDSATGKTMYLNYEKLDKCFCDESYLVHYLNDNMETGDSIKENVKQWYCRIMVIRLVNYYQYKLYNSRLKEMILGEKYFVYPLSKNMKYLKAKQKILLVAYFAFPYISDKMLKMICKWK